MKIIHTAAAAFTIVFFAACGEGSELEAKDAEPEAPKPLVRTQSIEMRAVRRTIETSSYLEAEHRVTVLSKVAGRLVEVVVDDSTIVSKGDVLARLDDREARSSVKQAEIQLQEAKVKHELAKLESEASTHRVSQARIERDKAKDIHKRNQEMGSKLIAAREIEESGYSVDAAVEALTVAEFDERKAKLDVTAAKNTVDDRAAKVADAKLNLEEHEVRAPFDGVVETRMVDNGETVGTATELFVITDPHRLVSNLRRPQRELAMIADAREVVFETDAWADREFHATIDLVSPVVDETNGTFRIRVRVPDKHAKDLRPGMFVRARILTENERQALMIPKSAILSDGADSSVFVVREGVAHRIQLDPGLEETDFLEARNLDDGGLRPTDQVIISGHRDLRDQAEVEVVK